MERTEKDIEGIPNGIQLLADIDMLSQYIERNLSDVSGPHKTILAGGMFHQLTGALIRGLKRDQDGMKRVAENLKSDVEGGRAFSNELFDKRAFAKYLLKEVLRHIKDKVFLEGYREYVDENRRMDDLRNRIDHTLEQIATN